jgi:hypothetical protein
MLKIELTEFQDKQGFDLDFKTTSRNERPRGYDTNSISISIVPGAQEQCEVSRRLDYVHGACSGANGRVTHRKHPLKSFPAVKPGRPCRATKARF